MNRVLGFDLVADSLEGSGVVHCEVSEHLAVDLDACLVDEAHELGVGEVLNAGSSVDTLNPECAEVALFLLAVAVSIGQTFFPGIFGDGPDVTARALVAAGVLEDFLAF